MTGWSGLYFIAFQVENSNGFFDCHSAAVRWMVWWWSFGLLCRPALFSLFTISCCNAGALFVPHFRFSSTSWASSASSAEGWQSFQAADMLFLVFFQFSSFDVHQFNLLVEVFFWWHHFFFYLLFKITSFWLMDCSFWRIRFSESLIFYFSKTSLSCADFICNELSLVSSSFPSGWFRPEFGLLLMMVCDWVRLLLLLRVFWRRSAYPSRGPGMRAPMPAMTAIIFDPWMFLFKCFIMVFPVFMAGSTDNINLHTRGV